MYTQFYNLEQKPFSLVPNPSFLYLSSEHKNALTYLEYGFTENVGFLMLTGGIGTGKTTLLRHILNRIDAEVEVAVLFNTNLAQNELIHLILNRFEIEYDKNITQSAALEILYEFLIEKYSQGKQVMLVVDEAQNLSVNSLEEIRMLSNLQTDEEMLLKVIIVGQPELKHKIESPELEQFAQRIAASYHLAGMSLEETNDYIEHRIKKAGRTEKLFTDEAILAVYEVSEGIPRIINLLCDAALVYGFADELQVIDEETIRQVVQEKDGIGLLKKRQVGHRDSFLIAGDTAVAIENLENRILKIERALTLLYRKFKQFIHREKVS